MAITGIMLLGFVVAHMIGNLKMYLGAADLNHYAEFLQRTALPVMPIAPRRVSLLWLMRLVGLLVAWCCTSTPRYSLTRLNRQARSVKYQGPRDYQVANFASRTMRATGMIVFLFLFWHLADLTWRFGEHRGHQRLRAWRRVRQRGAQLRPRAGGGPASTSSANIALGIHLFHGVWSLFQSMGWNNPRFNVWRRNFAAGFAAIIVIGNVSFPIAVLAGQHREGS